MPDTHAGAGAVIGFTAKMNDYIIPNVVGVDIGCGVNAIPLRGIYELNFPELDKFIKTNIPSGFSIRSAEEKMPNKMLPEDALGKELLDKVYSVTEQTGQGRQRVLGSVGTLGGGNHFIEIDRTEDGELWLLIHSGSRNFGLKTATYYQNKASDLLKQFFCGADAYKGLEYLPINLGGKEYLEAMKIAQEYAAINRKVMSELIMSYIYRGVSTARWADNIVIESVHNYINFEDSIIRKGAVSAHEGERLVIPFNMRDGTMVCRGKGNKKWNYSAPHGAGRILSRHQAKNNLKLEDFHSVMDGIYTTTANESTIDESPMAYKDKNKIIEAVAETVDIEFFMKPVYNFKAGDEDTK
jgi:RNA-splicing ligase RtcB